MTEIQCIKRCIDPIYQQILDPINGSSGQDNGIEDRRSIAPSDTYSLPENMNIRISSTTDSDSDGGVCVAASPVIAEVHWSHE